jgi:hypothetical protein
MQDLLKEPLDF